MRFLFAGSLLFVACVGDSPSVDGGSSQGTLGGPCFPNGTCNAGLVCVVPNQCVLADAGSDAPTSDATSDAASDASDADSGPCPTTGLVAWWKGDGTPADVEGYLALLEKAGASYISGAHDGSAFNLGGTNYLEAAPGGHATLPDVTTALTLEAWIDPTNVSSGTILSRRSDTGSGYEWRLEAGQLTFQTAGFTIKGTATLAAAIPHHVAVTVSQSSMQLYLDGAADGSPFPVANPIQADTAVVRVGSGWAPAQATKNLFVGWIDELAVYSKALDASDIGALHAGTAAKCH